MSRKRERVFVGYAAFGGRRDIDEREGEEEGEKGRGGEKVYWMRISRRRYGIWLF